MICITIANHSVCLTSCEWERKVRPMAKNQAVVGRACVDIPFSSLSSRPIKWLWSSPGLPPISISRLKWVLYGNLWRTFKNSHNNHQRTAQQSSYAKLKNPFSITWGWAEGIIRKRKEELNTIVPLPQPRWRWMRYEAIKHIIKEEIKEWIETMWTRIQVVIVIALSRR